MRRALAALLILLGAAPFASAEPRAMPAWIRLYLPIRPQLVPGAGGGGAGGDAVVGGTNVFTGSNTFTDSLFKICDNVDPTKCVQVEDTNITTGNTVVGLGFAGTAAAPKLLVPAGASGVPGLAFFGGTTTGLAYTGSLVMLNAGENILSGTATGVQMPSNHLFGWDSTVDNSDATAMDTGFSRYSAGVIKQSNGVAATVAGLFGGGAIVASATALPLPTGSVFHVSGTTNITSLTATNFASGLAFCMIFDGILTVTDGGNLHLAGNFVTTAEDVLCGVWDGTGFYETSRAIN